MFSVWWPGVSKAVEAYGKNCPHCQKTFIPSREPLILLPLPKRPWERVAVDLFELDGIQYHLVIDYYSRYPEVIQLRTTTSAATVNALKSIFGRHGIPSVLISNNGPQFNCIFFKQFASQYGFHHLTSSPRYPQSNGMVERAVKTVKGLLKGAPDPHMALLSFLATPLPWCSISPAKLLFGRKIATDLPQLTPQLTPHWPHLKHFKKADKTYKLKQKIQFDHRHRTRPLPAFSKHTSVWVRTGRKQIPGTIVSKTLMPRSYVVRTSSGIVRRNCHHLAPRLRDPKQNNKETEIGFDETLPDEPLRNEAADTAQDQTGPRSPIRTRLRTGTTLRAPSRYS